MLGRPSADHTWQKKKKKRNKKTSKTLNPQLVKSFSMSHNSENRRAPAQADSSSKPAKETQTNK
jgi:hypothetical protein